MKKHLTQAGMTPCQHHCRQETGTAALAGAACLAMSGI
jgi:hypothetical protein